MKEERAQILEMLQKGKITVDEADMLLDALAGTAVSAKNSFPPMPKTCRLSRTFLQFKGKFPKPGLKLTPEQIFHLNREGADPDFIRAVRQLHHNSTLTGDHIVRMAVEGVDPDFITAVSQLENLTPHGGSHYANGHRRCRPRLFYGQLMA